MREQGNPRVIICPSEPIEILFDIPIDPNRLGGRVYSHSTTKEEVVDLLLNGDVEEPWWLISIGSGVGHLYIGAEQMRKFGCAGVQTLAFDDVDPLCMRSTRGYVLFCDRHARSIIELLTRVVDKTRHRVVVQCSGGISRSAAVAQFISELWDLSSPCVKGIHHPNQHVLRVLRQQAGWVTFAVGQEDVPRRG